MAMKPIHILLATAALVAAPTLASAASTARSNSQSESQSVAGVYGSGNSANRNYLTSSNRNATIVNNTLGAGDSGGVGSGNGNGGIGGTIHNTPDIGVASYAGAANNCGTGGSLGGSGPGFGLTAAWAGESRNCRDQSWYIALRVGSENLAKADPALAALYERAARGVACQYEDVAKTAPPGFCAPLPQVVSYAQPTQPTVAYQPPVSDQTAQICQLWKDRVDWDVGQGLRPLEVPEQCR